LDGVEEFAGGAIGDVARAEGLGDLHEEKLQGLDGFRYGSAITAGPEVRWRVSAGVVITEMASANGGSAAAVAAVLNVLADGDDGDGLGINVLVNFDAWFGYDCGTHENLLFDLPPGVSISCNQRVTGVLICKRVWNQYFVGKTLGIRKMALVSDYGG
jgi:hypothetical protein